MQPAGELHDELSRSKHVVDRQSGQSLLVDTAVVVVSSHSRESNNTPTSTEGQQSSRRLRGNKPNLFRGYGMYDEAPFLWCKNHRPPSITSFL